MLGSIMHLEALSEPTCLGDGKDLVERSERVGIEVIQDHDDLSRIP
jgi:hypothetical protein